MDKNLSNIKERVLYIAEYKGIAKNKFIESIGMTYGNFNGSQRKRPLNSDAINNILSINDEINPEWLVLGKGPMLKSEAIHEKTEIDGGIPLIPIDAMAGWGEGDVQVMDYDTKRYVIPEFEELHVDFMIYVKGNSMIPRYSAGDLVACKKLPLDTFFQWNKIYVLDTIQGAMIKRIHQSDEESSIKCVSENPDYPPFDLHSDEINSIALVVGVVSFE